MAVPDDWAPYKLVHKDENKEENKEEWLCRWFARAGQRYNEPFFDETVLKCLSLSPNGKQYASFSTLDFLVEAAKHVEPVAPTAFIFHVSRCGSTLLAQLLGLHPQHIVLSEAPLIDSLLRLPLQDAQVSQSQIEPLLRAVVSLLGEQRFDENRLFIKLDSWHIQFAPFIRKLYPAVPFILLHRAPAAVIRSHQERRGMQAVPGLIEPQLFGLQTNELTFDNPDEYLANVLTYYYEQFAALVAQDERALLLDYRVGGEAMMSQFAQHAGLQLDTSMREQIRERGRFHSKHPGQAFAEERRPLAMPANLHLAELAYEKLMAVKVA
jgi:hypothetical protein